VGNQMSIMQESQGATIRTSRLNQFCFIDFVLFHLDHFVEIVFENNIFFFNIKIRVVLVKSF
ncbi:hypothetical protein NB98_09055, partial [Lactobacillus helveticus]